VTKTTIRGLVKAGVLGLGLTALGAAVAPEAKACGGYVQIDPVDLEVRAAASAPWEARNRTVSAGRAVIDGDTASVRVSIWVPAPGTRDEGTWRARLVTLRHDGAAWHITGIRRLA
jgi:hypothetical protein